MRRRPTYRHHVWADDFVAERTHDGRPVKILAVVDEYSRECLALVVARRLRSIDVLETVAELFVTYGVPAHIRSDNGPEFTAALVRLWLEALDVETLFIEPGSPWGKRLCGIRQRQTARCTVGPRDLLHVGRSEDLDRTMAAGVPHGAACGWRITTQPAIR